MTATLDTTLAALADPVRRHVVELLAARPRRAGELAAALEVSAPVMSRHLRVLRTADLVEDRHPPSDMRVRVYALRTDRIDELRDWLADAEAGWAQQLTALKEHVEGS